MFYSNWRLHTLVKDGSSVRFVEFLDTDAARRIWSEYRAQGFIPSEEVTPCTE
jgi:hypothetical protein